MIPHGGSSFAFFAMTIPTNQKDEPPALSAISNFAWDDVDYL